MSQLPMYSSKINSPQTTLANDIDATQTSIELIDSSVLADAPNIMTIMDGTNIETILYTNIVGNIVGGIIRGFEGNACSFSASNSIISRNFTNYDYMALCNNIKDGINKSIAMSIALG